MLVNQSLLWLGFGWAGPQEWTAVTSFRAGSKHDGLQLPRAPIWIGLWGAGTAAQPLMQIMQMSGTTERCPLQMEQGS